MKNLLFILTIFLLLGCSRDNEKPKTELEKLPPATQTGADTFGCLIDGKAFAPGHYNNSKNCFYQFTNGGYYFVVSAANHSIDHSSSQAVFLATEKKEIQEGGTYDLVEVKDDAANGTYAFNADFYTTSQLHTGKLTITKLSYANYNYIVSGTFWFDVVDKDGKLHQIRDGRFDMHFTN